MKYSLFIVFIGFISCSGSTPENRGPYAESACEMYDKVWELYRVEQYGLFSEYYPQSHKPELGYFEDGTKRTQEVSFLWPMSGVFSSTVLLADVFPERYMPYIDTMAMAVEKYYDDVRMPPGYQAYPVMFEKVDRYYDDNGLVGIDYVDSYLVTKNARYLEKAKQVMTFILSGWRPDHEGAVSWLEGVQNQKPGCSNGKAAVLALKLYKATSDPYYLAIGKRFYEWIDRHLHDKDLDIVWNSWFTEKGEVQKLAYTYNTGMLLQAAVMLYEFTGETEYLYNARQLAEGSLNYYIKYLDDGTPYINDLPWFVLVLFRGYHALYNIDGDPKYVNVIIASLDHAMSNARDNVGLVFHDWTGRENETSNPKWLLDESCIPEFLMRTSIIRQEL